MHRHPGKNRAPSYSRFKSMREEMPPASSLGHNSPTVVTCHLPCQRWGPLVTPRAGALWWPSGYGWQPQAGSPARAARRRICNNPRLPASQIAFLTLPNLLALYLDIPGGEMMNGADNKRELCSHRWKPEHAGRLPCCPGLGQWVPEPQPPPVRVSCCSGCPQPWSHPSPALADPQAMPEPCRVRARRRCW